LVNHLSGHCVDRRDPGFGVVAGTAAAVAKVLFVVFIVLFLVSLATSQRTPVP